ncbi:MAG: hypothetical protein R3A10_00135 [Caldilineaceae bacterium]
MGTNGVALMAMRRLSALRRQREIDNGLDVVVGLGGVTDHGRASVAESYTPAPEWLHHLLFGLGLVDDVTQALAACLKSDGEILRAYAQPWPG